MATTCLTYPLPDPELILGRIKDAGGPFIKDTPTGSILYDHCHISWTQRLEDDGKRFIDLIVEHPFFVSEDEIKAHVDPLFNDASKNVAGPATAVVDGKVPVAIENKAEIPVTADTTNVNKPGQVPAPTNTASTPVQTPGPVVPNVTK